MHKRAFQALKRMFLHFSGLPPPYFDKKTKLFINSFYYQNMVGKTLDMHKRAFQALKRTFMFVSGLPTPYFDKRNQILYKLVFFSKYGLRRPKTCINLRFGA